MEAKNNIELIIKTIEKTVKLTNIDTGLLVELGDFLASRTFLGMIAEETQKKLSDFLFASKDTSVVDQNENTSNPREPLRDFFMELYCNLELVGITPDIMRSVVKNVYQAIITSTAIIPNHEVKSKYVTSNKIPNEETFDVFLVVSCLIRLYITQFNNFVKNKMEKEHEK